MALSIRARLALWYSLVMLATLVAAALVLSALHMRLGLNRLDRGLEGNLVTATIGVDHELDEGLDLRQAVADALSELELPGSGVAILDPHGAVLGTRASGVPTPAEPTLREAHAQPISVNVEGQAARMRTIWHARRGYTYRLVVWTSLAPFEAERATVMRTLWLAMPAGLLLAAAGGWVIGWRLLAPLSSMVRQANAIDDRRLDARLTVPGTDDELSTLATAFNSLLDRVAAAFQAQRRFMADASHQLRTPLSIARTAAQVTLAQPERSVAEYRESLGTVARQTERLTHMVDDMSSSRSRISTRSAPARGGLPRRDCQRVRVVGARAGGRARRHRRRPRAGRRADAGRSGPASADDPQPRRERRPAYAGRRFGAGGGRSGRESRGDRGVGHGTRRA